MSEKLEAIQKLQEELFVDEYGVTKEQARKLNEFIFHESVGKEFDFWSGREVPKPSVNVLVNRLEKKIEDQSKQISDLEWEHKKLWMGTTIFGMLSVAIAAMSYVYFTR